MSGEDCVDICDCLCGPECECGCHEPGLQRWPLSHSVQLLKDGTVVARLCDAAGCDKMAVGGYGTFSTSSLEAGSCYCRPHFVEWLGFRPSRHGATKRYRPIAKMADEG